jgi:hypothetical protein
MSGECDNCGEHTLDCICRSSAKYVLARTCGTNCPCRFKEHYTHLNLVRIDVKDGKHYKNLNVKTISLIDDNYPSTESPQVKWLQIRGREEHEAILKDASWCEELGLDQIYEIAVYLNRWGGWLGD